MGFFRGGLYFLFFFVISTSACDCLADHLQDVKRDVKLSLLTHDSKSARKTIKV